MTAAARFPAFHLHPDVLGLVGGLALAYAWAARRWAASRHQQLWFGLGLLTIWIASDWPVHDLAEGYLYSVHMVQHLLLSLVAAPLLLLGVPAGAMQALLRRQWLGPAVRAVARPFPALVQFNAIIVFSHWPLWVDITLRHHAVHFVAHALLLVSALAMWAPVVEPAPEMAVLTPPAKMLYLFLQSIIPTVPASFLTFGSAPLYRFYETVPRLWGVSALSDQQVAGLIMKVGGGLYLWTLIGVIFFRWYAREEASSGVLTWDRVERELAAVERQARTTPS